MTEFWRSTSIPSNAGSKRAIPTGDFPSWLARAGVLPFAESGHRGQWRPTASARCLLWSFDSSEIEELQHKGDWDGLTAPIVDAIDTT